MRGMKIGKVFDSALRIAGAIFLLGLLVLALASFWPQMTALAWHLRHGNLVHVGEYTVTVPRWWYPEVDRAPSEVRIERRSDGFSMMTFSVGMSFVSAEPQRKALESYPSTLDPRVGWARAQIAEEIEHYSNTTIAGQPTVCFEKFHRFVIQCVPERGDVGLTADYTGKAEYLPLFYETLSKITKANASPK